MEHPVVIIVAVMLGTVAVMRLVGRLVEPAHDVLAVASAVVIRVGLAASFVLLAIRAAERGGYAWIEVALLGLLTLWTVVTAGLMIWALVREGVHDDAQSGHESAR